MSLKRSFCLVLIFLIGLAPGMSLAAPWTRYPYDCTPGQNFVNDVKRDFRVHFTSRKNLFAMGVVLVGAGILANTGLDTSFRDAWQNGIRSRWTDNFFQFPQDFAGQYAAWHIPAYLAAMGLGYYWPNTCCSSVIYHWGYRSIRTFILGGVQQLILVSLIGGGRPINNASSHWSPFKSRPRGVSGHAFLGAIPFLTAAHMTEPLAGKVALYVLSTLPGLARINSDAHYLSQVILGWSIAYFSSRSVYLSDVEKVSNMQLSIYPKRDGMMLGVHWEF